MAKKIYEFCDGERFEVNVPTNFHLVTGNVRQGCIIENAIGDQYVRIPLGYTASGMFTRGFWISRYEISRGERDIPRSIAGKEPWISINYPDAVEVAESVGMSIISGEEYDRLPIWLLETKAVQFEQMFIDGNGLGNFSNPFRLKRTGSNSKWMINNLDNLWGNCYTWTTERSELYDHHRIIRGGHDCYGTLKNTLVCRKWQKQETKRDDVGFRLVIHDEKLVED